MKTIAGAFALFLLIAVTAYLAFFYAPIEKTMGPIQKIFYLHLPSAFSSFIALGICFYANLMYVFKRQPKWTGWVSRPRKWAWRLLPSCWLPGRSGRIQSG